MVCSARRAAWLSRSRRSRRYTAWSFASIIWARAPGVAFEGSARTLLYLVCFAAFALLPWTPRAARAALVLFIAAVSVVGVVTLVRATSAQHAADLFVDGRLTAPFGYQNASAALWTMAALPALAMAASRSLPLPARALLLAASGFLLGMAVLAQSRGWLFTLPLVALVALAVLRGTDRARLIAYAIPVGGVLALALPRLLEPYDAAGGRPEDVARGVHDAMGPAAASLALVAGGLLVLGALLVWGEGHLVRRAQQSPTLARALRRGRTGLVVAVLVGGVAAGLVAAHGDPVGRVDTAWQDFKDVDSEGARTGTSRFADLSSIRYDFWRVGLDAWRAHPLGGLGQDNFAETYVRDRVSTSTEARWLHSLEFRVLVHTGLIGVALLFAFAGSVAAAALRGSWDQTRRAAAIALMPAVVWGTHGSVDWLWEYPALSGPAFAFAAVAAALGRAEQPAAAVFGVRGRTAVRGGAVALAVAGSVAIVPAYVAELEVGRALTGWPSDPAAAFKRLDRALDLNPLDAHPALVEGLIDVELGRMGDARAAFEEAVARQPDGWLAPLQLGLIASAGGDRTTAAREYRRARARNPLAAVIGEALQRVNSRRPLTFAEANAAIASESARQQGRPPPRQR